MIRFIKESGETFDGVYPYIHWLEGQLSTGLWYTIELMFVSDQETLQTSSIDENSIYKFIDTSLIDPSQLVDLDLNIISTKSSITSTGVAVNFEGSERTWYIHQLILVCNSETAGEYIQEFMIGNDKIAVGVDLYELDETLQINLLNRGTDLPISIQKAIFDSDINDDSPNYALINRKFKELISNYIDIMDCKGSYKSLYNSLKWFDWGENTKLFEVWQKEDGTYFEKELSMNLSDVFSNLIFTHKKTTHLTISSAIQKVTNEFDDERNPVVERIVTKWNNNELAIKISLLGAFFERYFMPIHLDLKRACIESLIYTNQIKELTGSITDKFHFHEDTGVINITMDHSFILGNIDFVAVGKDTVFGKHIDSNKEEGDYKYVEPIGIDRVEDISKLTDSSLFDFNNDFGGDFLIYGSSDPLYSEFYMQLKKGIGVIVPIKIDVELNDGDFIKTEILTTYRYVDGTSTPIIDQITEHKIYPSPSVSFSFNLLSTKEEKVCFKIMLISTSGHVWTASSSYKTIDVSGSYLDIYKVNIPNPNDFNSIDEWLENDEFVPYPSQFTVNENDVVEVKNITQYLPYLETVNLSQFNQLIVIKNTLTEGEYDIEWLNTPGISRDFWIIRRTGEYDIDGNINTIGSGTFENPKYVMLILKASGKRFDKKSDFKSEYNLQLPMSNIVRMDMIYVPQLHTYINIENGTDLQSYTFTQDDLLCIVPQFKSTVKRNIDINSIFWRYTNKTTLESIDITLPVQTPLVANNTHTLLPPGYWTVTMYYKLTGSDELHELTKNSAFKIIK